MFHGAFSNRTVWLSGHTGFKGAWLAEWLLRLGARVHGFSLPPTTQPALFDQLGLAGRLHHELGDIRDLSQVTASIARAQPDFVFHLAAQPLVLLSYDKPVETYAANVMGTVHVLEALRALQKPCAAVFITTDKCYENRNWLHGYREEDPMGGHDPYSSSKGMAELAISSYRRSFFSKHPVRIASARAGNVIGGGDWAENRIVPDSVRSLLAGERIGVRNPLATRPWQHVLEPLSGYLWLAARLAAQSQLDGAYNFGPGLNSNRAVADLVSLVLKHWPGEWDDLSDPNAVHEARFLNLATDKAFHLLQWQPVWSFEQTVANTIHWYRQCSADAAAAPSLTLAQIGSYTADAQAAGLPWAA